MEPKRDVIQSPSGPVMLVANLGFSSNTRVGTRSGIDITNETGEFRSVLSMGSEWPNI